jgi:heavy metal sensor kinase
VSLPIRARLTIWYTVVLAGILLILGFFLVTRLRSDLIGSVDHSLSLAASEISVDYKSGGESEFRDVTDRSMAGLDRARSAAQVLTPPGRVLDYAGVAGPHGAIVDPAVIDRASTGKSVAATGSLGGVSFRYLAEPFRQAGGNAVLVVATSLATVNRSVNRVLLLLLVGAPMALAMCALGGWWIARRALRPVARMTEEAGRISEQEPDRRVPVPPTTDELSRLALTLNAMLDRLQAAIRQQRRFTADASHELRTPLAVMGAELDVALGAPDLEPEARETLESAKEEVDHMSRMVQDLLVLARIDAGRLELLNEPLDLSPIVDRRIAAMRTVAARRGVTIEYDPGGHADTLGVMGDPERLGQVLTNLVDNAIRHAPESGIVEVAVWAEGSDAGVTVRDHGRGIAADALPHVFERFYRVDQNRDDREGGSGLGLAIAREIVIAHGGRIWAVSEPGKWTAFSVALPRIGAEKPV